MSSAAPAAQQRGIPGKADKKQPSRPISLESFGGARARLMFRWFRVQPSTFQPRMSQAAGFAATCNQNSEATQAPGLVTAWPPCNHGCRNPSRSSDWHRRLSPAWWNPDRFCTDRRRPEADVLQHAARHLRRQEEGVRAQDLRPRDRHGERAGGCVDIDGGVESARGSELLGLYMDSRIELVKRRASRGCRPL